MVAVIGWSWTGFVSAFVGTFAALLLWKLMG
jgi:hypothetical protein